MFNQNLNRLRFIGVGVSLLLIAACQQVPVIKSVAISAPPSSIEIYSPSNPNAKVTIENPNGVRLLSGATAEVPLSTQKVYLGSERAVTRATKNQQGISFIWSDTWSANLNFSFAAPTDLSPYLASGVVQFDIRVDSLAQGGLALKRSCGENCIRKIPFVIPAREIQAQGWKTFSVPLHCFFHKEDSLTDVQDIFSVDAGGTGEIAVAKVQLNAVGTANLNCSDYQTQSVNAEPLSEWWALSWWMPRHEKKLQEIKSRPIDLVFVGDSITEGWEKSGASVWQKYYAKRNALDLGYGGDRTENLLWRLLHGEIDALSPKLFVMMIGTNNTGHRMENPEITAAGIRRNLQEIRARVPAAKILVLAIFPRDEFPTDAMRAHNEKINAIIETYADNKQIFFLNINSVFLDQKGVLSKEIMPDLLHPNGKGYELWAQAMEPTLIRLMK